MEVWGAIGVSKGSHVLKMASPTSRLDLLKAEDPLTMGLASCHSLTHINGELIGDPLDLQMFQATKWVRLAYFIVLETLLISATLIRL